PQLALLCTGPEQALYGETVTLKVKVTNSGDGTAEGVMLTQTDAGDSESAAIAQLPAKIGTLAPGQSQEIELRVPANATGTLHANLIATAAGELEAKAVALLHVRRPMLEIKAEGPSMRYAQRIGNYALRLSNPGDAPAKNISVVAQIPAGLQVVAIDKRAT